MPRHTQTYLDAYSVKVAPMLPDGNIQDTEADIELLFHNEDHSDIITVPIPSAMRPKLAALLVGMVPAEEGEATTITQTPGEALNAELAAVGEETPEEEQEAAQGRCRRCGARDSDERVALCPNAALIQVGDVGAIEGFAESGCAAAIATFDDIAQVDPAERADINDEPNGDGA